VPQELNRQYHLLKAISLKGLGGAPVAELISQMARRARHLLAHAKQEGLASKTGKTYFHFLGADESRPVNAALYVPSEEEFEHLSHGFLNGFEGCSPEEIVRATYSIAFGVMAANDVHKVGRKASATFFEVLIGHIVARAIGVAPRKKVIIPESGAKLPTDYVFDPGKGRRKIHLPLKTSTRERAVQAWVHQLVLERIFGADEYLGALVVGSETNKRKISGDVVEICVPGQLQMFQSRLTRMTRVYYLDPPQPYLDLATAHPRVDVRSFGGALTDLRELLDGH
jgi:hypothetical protein